MSNDPVNISTWEYAAHLCRRFVLLAGDMSAVLFAYVLGFMTRFHYGPMLNAFPVVKGYPPIEDYLIASPIVLVSWVLAISWQNAYQHWRIAAIDEAVRIFRATLVGTLLSMSAMFLYRETSFSRLVFLLGGAFGCAFVYGFRQLLKISYVMWVQKNRRPKRVLIVGNGYLSQALGKMLERQGDRAVLKRNSLQVEAIENTIVRSRINEVLLANPNVNHREAVRLATFCEERGVMFRLIPDILEIRMGEVLIDDSLGIPTFQLRPVSLHGSAFLAKRVLDVVVSSIGLGLFLLPGLAIALLIKTSSSGPVFYKHKRVGYKGQPFDFMKFRTMVQNAESLLAELKDRSDREGPVFKMKRDPRITAIGKLLRRFSLDEIPQLINVLRGEMSLIGPRPQVIWETESYNDWARKRLNVLPGVTGLWQVSGRAELTYEEMIELDIYYIEHWSLGLDVKILMKTLPAVFSGKGAY